MTSALVMPVSSLELAERGVHRLLSLGDATLRHLPDVERIYPQPISARRRPVQTRPSLFSSMMPTQDL